MKVPLPLLSKWIQLDKSPSDIAEALTAAGLEVDSIEGNTLDVSLTPNLSHCMSLFGIARELSALFKLPLKEPAVGPLVETGKPIDQFIQADVRDEAAAPLYCLRVIDGVKVAPSPSWLVDELKLLGLKSINNVVDVTNYVMHLIGQPLHAFDGDKISSSQLIVRKARNGESLELLDGRTIALTEEMLLIADDKKPLALAGIMGGLGSSVSHETKSLVLESAHFSAPVIRRSSKKSQTSTESSKRFERGHDPHLTEKALDYAAWLIQSLSGGQIAKGSSLLKVSEFPSKTLVLRHTKVEQILGLHLSLSEIEALLKRLQFRISYEQEGTLQVKVPTFRVDVNSEIDLVEEIARLYGLNHLPRKRSSFRLSSTVPSPFYLFSKEMEQKALKLGLNQLLTSDLLGPKDVDDMSNLIEVNAAVKEQSILRPSLLPGFLHSLKHNIDFKQNDFAAFESGHVYYKLNGRYLEEEKLALILHGKAAAPHWSLPQRPFDYFDLKGIVQKLIGPLSLKMGQMTALHPYRQNEILIDREKIGFLGELNPLTTKKFGIETPVYFAEISLRLLAGIKRTPLRFKPLPHYPSTERDLTLNLAEETAYERLLEKIQECQSSLLESLSLVSVYRHESLGKGRKNLTLRFSFRSQDKTLSFEEAEQEFARLSHALESSYGV